jgi:hypothetical protein
MTNIVLNLNHMSLNVELGDAAADPSLLSGGHPLYYITKTKRATEVYLNRAYELLSVLPKHMKVVELYAGVGLYPKMLWHALEPHSWTSIELDPSCEAVYQEPRAVFRLDSVFDVPQGVFANADLVIVDAPTNTLRKMREDKQIKPLMDRIFESGVKYVELTDVEYYWIHLQNHWPHYNADFELLGFKERPDTATLREFYSEIMHRHVFATYGYKMIRMTVGGGAQYFLFEKGE